MARFGTTGVLEVRIARFSNGWTLLRLKVEVDKDHHSICLASSVLLLLLIGIPPFVR